MNGARSLARRLLPSGVRGWLARRVAWPPVGAVRFGSLRRTTPISSEWGYDRGQPVDRYYIEAFLERRAADIRGRVLEIDAPTYTTRFGGGRVNRSDVLHVADARPGVTIVGDLTREEDLPRDAFDCAIVTQTLQTIYDVRAAIRTLHRTLRPGGVVLATAPGISKVSRLDMDRWGYSWAFTSYSLRRLFAEAFPPEHVEVEARGNVLAAIAFLHGIAAGELTREELESVDPDYEVLLAVRAVKGEARG